MTTPMAPPLSPLTTLAIIDNEQFEDMRELLEEDFDELVQTYLIDSQSRVLSLRQALNCGDDAQGFDIAHTLKGASANIGAPRLTECCALLQEACRQNTLSQQSALIERIADELNLATIEIRQRLG